MKIPHKWSREWCELQNAARDRYNELYHKVIKSLPQSQWYKCPTCNGTGSYEESGDAHRSPGIVPCYNCSGGICKTRYATVDRTTGTEVDETLARKESGFTED